MNFQECLKSRFEEEKRVENIPLFQQASCFRLYSHTLNHITLESNEMEEEWRWKRERTKLYQTFLFEKMVLIYLLKRSRQVDSYVHKTQ